MRKNVLEKVQHNLKSHSIDAYILPKTDPHRTEYTLECDNLLYFLTGFSGSAGFAAISPKNAAIFIDGRYKLQAKNEVDPTLFSYQDYSFNTIVEWLQEEVQPGGKVAYDPLLLTIQEHEKLATLLERCNLSLISLDENIVRSQWHDAPQSLIPPIQVHGEQYSGMALANKIALVQDTLNKGAQKCHGLFLNTPESIAWLFNIRAKDRPIMPAASLYAYVPHQGKSLLFMHETQRSQELQAHLGTHVEIRNYTTVFEDLKEIAASKTIWLDPMDAMMKTKQVIESVGGTVFLDQEPCILPKACKNTIEIQGARQAHIRDGIALCRFLHWLEETGLKTPLRELEIVQKLYNFRNMDPSYQGKSFDAIAGSGPHGAIVHYRVTPETDRVLKPDDIFLIDSGGQYYDGTTDVTRTLILNKQPTTEQKNRFTRVLKGHIALASVKFPSGTSGSQLDALARQYLWQIGCDYAHGTGHGVGSYLNVHEGPHRISSAPNTVPLAPGMIVSNEPGYYKEGAYGIRIENLIVVKTCDERTGHEQEMLEFENLTLVPLDHSLMDMTLLTSEEIQWINDYHHTVYEQLQQHLDGETRRWLAKATAPLSTTAG